MNYEELVKALRCCIPDPLETCEGCTYKLDGGCNVTGMMSDAAAAIEELQAAVQHQKDMLMEFGGETGIRQMRDVLGHWQEEVVRLRAEVKRLKERNDELREKQTYIDHYGDRWMTSAKDVPTAAYEHGYADGWDEAMAKMEVQDASRPDRC